MHSHKVGTVTTRTSCVAGHGTLMDGQCGGVPFKNVRECLTSLIKKCYQ